MDIADVALAGATLGVAGFLAGAALEHLTKALHWAVNRARRWAAARVTVSATFTYKDPAYDYVAAWFAQYPRAHKAHNVRAVYDEHQKQFRTIPGGGTHWGWWRGPMWVRYGAPEAKAPGSPEKGDAIGALFSSALLESNNGKLDLTVTLLTLDPGRLAQFMNEVVLPAAQPKAKERDYVEVYSWIGYWSRSTFRKRQMETVYLPAAQKAAMVRAVTEFAKDGERYQRWGIPYRLGLELRGPTGTGKTTAVRGLAGLLDRPIYVVNLNAFSDDQTLQRAFYYMRSDAVPLIEDIDTFPVARRREGVQSEQEIEGSASAPTTPAAQLVASAAPKSEEKQKVSLSGLLNAIDGLGATEGRILIMTTNDHAKLDPALVRSARVDHVFDIGPLGAAEVEEMFRNFFPEFRDEAAQVRLIAESRPPRTAAAWQKRFIDGARDVPGLLADLRAESGPYR